jgi:hypothetical protein
MFFRLHGFFFVILSSDDFGCVVCLLPLISKLNSTLMSELNVSLVTELAMGSIVKERG